MGSLEVRNIIICPQCGHTQFTAKTECSVSVKFYIDNNIIYPETNVFDTDDDALIDIECANCNYTLSSSFKDLIILINTTRKCYAK